VVIVADAVYNQRQLGRTGIIDRVGGSLELQIGARALTCTTEGWQKAEGREQVRDAAEERRLWYVAATRVRDHLVIPVLSPTQRSLRGEQWVFADESLSGALAEDKTESNRVFVYRGLVRTVEKPTPALPAAQTITTVSPEPVALRTYQEWESRLRATLTRGRETGVIKAVTELAETRAAPEFSPGYGKLIGPSIRRSSLRLGRVVHNTLQRGDANATVPALSGLRDATERENTQGLIASVQTSSVLARAKTATERFSELPFVLHSEGRLLEGVIDFAFIEAGAWVVVDFTTDVVVEAEAEERAKVYRPQLYVYALALERLTNRPVKELVLFFIQSCQEVVYSWDNDKRVYIETLLSRKNYLGMNSE
jgi:ATP-dependent exoDNAse (exonuclease V) beta subunit